MKVIGLLSSQNEANEIKKIAKICQIEDRIHFLVRMDKVKKIIREKRKN
jgi:predicted Zn-ribbon and HTH transcriptional regulator